MYYIVRALHVKWHGTYQARYKCSVSITFIIIFYYYFFLLLLFFYCRKSWKNYLPLDMQSLNPNRQRKEEEEEEEVVVVVENEWLCKVYEEP